MMQDITRCDWCDRPLTVRTVYACRWNDGRYAALCAQCLFNDNAQWASANADRYLDRVIRRLRIDPAQCWIGVALPMWCGRPVPYAVTDHAGEWAAQVPLPPTLRTPEWALRSRIRQLAKSAYRASQKQGGESD